MTIAQQNRDPFGTRATLATGSGSAVFYRLSKLEEDGLGNVSGLPYSIKVLLEAVLRQCDDFAITEDDVKNLAAWSPSTATTFEVPYKPARVILQDLPGYRRWLIWRRCARPCTAWVTIRGGSIRKYRLI
jgi:aconitate hydratase